MELKHDYKMTEHVLKTGQKHCRASIFASLVVSGAGSLVVVVVGGVRGASRGLGALRSTEQKLLHT